MHLVYALDQSILQNEISSFCLILTLAVSRSEIHGLIFCILYM